jgi:hypothetical protein
MGESWQKATRNQNRKTNMGLNINKLVECEIKREHEKSRKKGKIKIQEPASKNIKNKKNIHLT